MSPRLDSGKAALAEGVPALVHPKVETTASLRERLQGSWQDRDEPGFLVGVEGSRLVISFGGRVREVAEILGATEGRIRVCKIGRDSEIALEPNGDMLTFHDETRGKIRKLRKLAREPKDLSLSFKIPDAMPLSEDKIRQVQGEVYKREEAEQGAMHTRKSPSPFPWLGSRTQAEPEPLSTNQEFFAAARTTENTEYMRRLLSEVGWIDVPRFGYGASHEAFLLVQHSWDVPLLMAVLPRLKKDVDSGKIEADAYALLFDRLALALGRPQRYGSQVVSESSGGIIVLPVEDPGKVEELRKQLGLISLKEYVGVFGAPEVKLSSACSERGASVAGWAAVEGGAIEEGKCVARLAPLLSGGAAPRQSADLERTAVERPVRRDGFFQLAGVSPGNYTLEVRQPGYSPAESFRSASRHARRRCFASPWS